MVGGRSEVQRLGWLVGGRGARQPKRVRPFGILVGIGDGGVGVGGGVGGRVRGPETGLAGRRPRSQATKTRIWSG